MTRPLIFAALIAILAFSTPAPASAQADGASGQTLIAVIDMNRLRENSIAVKDIRRQLEDYRSTFRDEIQKEEQALLEANKELSRQRSILAPEAFAEERQKFESQLADVQRRVQELRRDFAVSERQAMETVQKQMESIVEEIASENRIALVLRRDQTVMVIDAMDITGLVLDRVNKALPTVSVPKPGQAQ